MNFKKINIKTYLTIAVSCILVLMIMITLHLETKANLVQEKLAKEVIRFHIRANSNDYEDQVLKMQIKDLVIDYLEQTISTSHSVDETRAILMSQLPEIEGCVEQYLEVIEKNYAVKVALDQEYFPVKAYGDVVFPEGTYEALIIELGDAKGDNWWCVMYPQLCFVDASTGYLPEDSKAYLKEHISEEAYETIEEKPYEVKFKLLELLGI